MANLSDPQIAAPALAALSAACFVFGIFRSRMNGIAYSARRSILYRKLIATGDPTKRMSESRSLKRAQEAALKSVARQGKKRRQSRLQDALSAAGFSWTPVRFIAVCVMIGATVFLFALSAGRSPVLAAVLAILSGYFVPQRYLGWRAEGRKQAFLKAFSPAIEMIIRGAKSGLSLMDCLTMVASDAPSPVREEFQTISSQLAAGVALPAAMEKFARTMPAPEIRFFAMVMSAQSQTGGNLTDALSNLANVLRQRERLATKVRIASAEGKISALIIGILPFFVIGGTYAFSPDYISFLWTDETGRKAGFFSLVWLIIGIFILIRMSKFEV
jgi:tight adherence protein B